MRGGASSRRHPVAHRGLAAQDRVAHRRPGSVRPTYGLLRRPARERRGASRCAASRGRRRRGWRPRRPRRPPPCARALRPRVDARAAARSPRAAARAARTARRGRAASVPPSASTVSPSACWRPSMPERGASSKGRVLAPRAGAARGRSRPRRSRPRAASADELVDARGGPQRRVHLERRVVARRSARRRGRGGAARPRR